MVSEVPSAFGQLNRGRQLRIARHRHRLGHGRRSLASGHGRAFYTCKATAKHLVNRFSGAIILVSSTEPTSADLWRAVHVAKQA
jgi:hypothetical protein